MTGPNQFTPFVPGAFPMGWRFVPASSEAPKVSTAQPKAKRSL
jgi:hypothetical protein